MENHYKADYRIITRFLNLIRLGLHDPSGRFPNHLVFTTLQLVQLPRMLPYSIIISCYVTIDKSFYS